MRLTPEDHPDIEIRRFEPSIINSRDWLDVGDSRPETDQTGEPVSRPSARTVRAPRFELTKFSNVSMSTTALYLVKRLVPREGLTIIYGPPKCGKTFWLFDLLMHVALGRSYRGRAVRSGPVVYCACEGASGFTSRIEAWRRDRLGDDETDVPFYLLGQRLAFVKDHKALIASIRFELGKTPPVAVVLDTMKRSSPGVSDSDDLAVSNYVDAADAVKEAFGCAVIIVHHSGLEGGRPRGSTALPGAADAQLSCDKDDTGNVVVTVQLMKDGPEGDRIVSSLRPVEVGVDEDGEPITSLVVDEADAPGSSAPKENKLPNAARIALTALHEAIDELGVVPPSFPQIPPNTRCVTDEQWRTFAYKRGISNSSEERARQVAFTRSSDALVAKRRIAIWDGWAWPL